MRESSEGACNPKPGAGPAVLIQWRSLYFCYGLRAGEVLRRIRGVLDATGRNKNSAVSGEELSPERTPANHGSCCLEIALMSKRRVFQVGINSEITREKSSWSSRKTSHAGGQSREEEDLHTDDGHCGDRSDRRRTQRGCQPTGKPGGQGVGRHRDGDFREIGIEVCRRGKACATRAG